MKKAIYTIIISLMLVFSSLGQDIPLDKVAHFSFGYMIGSTTTSLFEEKLGKDKAILVGCGVAAVAGIAKELIYDELLREGTNEFNDLGATILGGVLGSVVITINF